MPVYGTPVHVMMVASMSRSSKTRSQSNKMVYICFLVNFVCVLAMLSSPMHAADAAIGAGKIVDQPVASSLLNTVGTGQSYAPASITHTVSVVRVDRTTGKLIRSVGPSTSAPRVLAAAPLRLNQTPPRMPPRLIDELVQKSARAHGVDPLLVHSVIQVESAYNAHAVSPKGAEGLMQLMPGTSAKLGVGNSFDPGQNIEAGVRYLKSLQTLYHDDRLALAAYNAGPAAVDRYKNVPPYAETINYVEQVGARYRASHERSAHEQAEKTAPLAHGDNPIEQSTIVDDLENSTDTQIKHPKLEQYTDDQGRFYLKTAVE